MKSLGMADCFIKGHSGRRELIFIPPAQAKKLTKKREKELENIERKTGVLFIIATGMTEYRRWGRYKDRWQKREDGGKWRLIKN